MALTRFSFRLTDLTPDGITDNYIYELASVLVWSQWGKKISGVAIGADGERELRRLTNYVDIVLSELNGEPAKDGFRFELGGVLDLSFYKERFGRPERYFIQPSEIYPVREVMEETSWLSLPENTDLIFPYDMGVKTGRAIASTLNYRRLYESAKSIAVGASQDSTGSLPYSGYVPRYTPYTELDTLLKRILPPLVPALKRAGVYDQLVIRAPYPKRPITTTLTESSVV